MSRPIAVVVCDDMSQVCTFVRSLFTPHKGKAVSLQITARLESGGAVKVQRGETVMLLLRDDQRVSLSIQPLDARGNPARVDGIPAWNNSDELLGTLVAAADGFSAVFSALQIGTCQISVTVDADLGDGVRNLSGTLDIQIEPGEAVSIGIIAGVPESQ